MPIATLVDDHGRRRSFHVDICVFYVLYGRTLFARQPGGDWEKDSTYRATGLMVLDDTMRTDRQPPTPQEMEIEE